LQPTSCSLLRPFPNWLLQPCCPFHANRAQAELNPRLTRRCHCRRPSVWEPRARPYLRAHGSRVARLHLFDWLVLALLAIIGVALNLVEPFHRFVGEDMMTSLRYPMYEGQHRARLGRAGILLVHAAIRPSLQPESPILIVGFISFKSGLKIPRSKLPRYTPSSDPSPSSR
jgi:hypothetical protein